MKAKLAEWLGPPPIAAAVTVTVYKTPTGVPVVVISLAVLVLLPHAMQTTDVANNRAIAKPKRAFERVCFIGAAKVRKPVTPASRPNIFHSKTTGPFLVGSTIASDAVVLIVTIVLPLPVTEFAPKLQLLWLPTGEIEHEDGAKSIVPV